MAAHPEPTAPAEIDGAFVRECELAALRRLAKLTESENERVALRAAEVLVKYATQRRRDEARAASGGRKPSASPGEVRTGSSRPPLAEAKPTPGAPPVRREAPMG